MPLIPERPVIAPVRMVVLVIGEPFAGPEIALIGTGGVTIHRAHPGDNRAARIQADILDQEIANDRGRSGNLALTPRRRGKQRTGDGECRKSGSLFHHSGNSTSTRNRNVLGLVSAVSPRRSEE